MNFWQNKKILVTGGAGFIGSRVAIKLVQAGANVRVVDNLSKGESINLENILDKIEFKQLNLLNTENAEKSMEGIDVCFHFAAIIGGIGYFHKYPATSVRDNSILNLNLWDASKKEKTKIVCLSSSMVFERASVFPTPEKAIETSPPPLTGYGFSKLVSEYIAKTYFEEFGVPYVIARPFNAYGPGEVPGDYIGYSHIIPDLVKKILSGQYPLEILGSGDQTRSYTYVDDLADAIIFIAEKAENDDFNIGTGIETSVKELAEKIWKICRTEKEIKFKNLSALQYDVQKRVPDISKITALGWKPKVDLDTGLGITVDWLKKRLSIYPAKEPKPQEIL